MSRPAAHSAAALRRASLGTKANSKSPALFSMIFSDSKPVTLGQMSNAEAPKHKPEAFKQAKEWRKKNLYVGAILELKQSYTTFGMRVVSGDSKKSDEFDTWLTGKKKNTGKTAALPTRKKLWINRFISNGHRDGLLLDNIAPMWFSEDPLKSDVPNLLELEDCLYADALGIERLTVDFGIKDAEGKAALREAGLTEAQIKRYSKPVTLDEDEGEHFIVWTRGVAGRGFCFPRLYSIFRTCSQQESMEVGESLLAYSSRLVVRMHRKGFEPRTTSVGLKLKDFMWTEEWAEQVKKNFAPGRNGFMEATGNFDHDIKTHWVDTKLFDGGKWDTIMNRLIWWAGPLGFMLLAKSNSANWMTLFQTEVLAFRGEITPYLEFALNSVFTDAPGGIRIEYDDTCFKDSRLVWDMLKTLLMTGPASLTTALKAAGLNVEVEGDNREEEAKHPKRFGAPLYDPAHATANGKKANSDKGGRRTGGRDGDKVQ